MKADHATSTRKATALPRSGGEMGDRLRAFDWAETPLGPPQRWPQSLRSAVEIMLACPQPMLVWWGESFAVLYNDAAVAVLGDRHPAALGQPAASVWQNAWSEIEPRVEAALRTTELADESTVLVATAGNGAAGAGPTRFRFSPLSNDDGGTGGVLCAAVDDAARGAAVGQSTHSWQSDGKRRRVSRRGRVAADEGGAAANRAALTVS